MKRSLSAASGAALLAACACASSAAAQRLEAASPAHPGDGYRAPWTEHATVLGANAVLGGVTAGVLQAVRGGSFADGFTRGFAGGAVVYGGKRLAGQRFDGAGLLGREVAAVGGSMVRNAGEGRPSLERVTLPLTVVRLEVRTGEDAGVRARLDAHGAFWLAYGLVDPALRLDVGASASAGTPVFRAPNRILRFAGQRAPAVALPGVIVLGGHHPPHPESDASIFAHERIHILQQDQVHLFWDAPLQAAVAPHLSGVRSLHRWADLDLLFPLVVGAGTVLLPHPRRPWEAEANVLGGR